jgi:hypothetical protein
MRVKTKDTPHLNPLPQGARKYVWSVLQLSVIYYYWFVFQKDVAIFYFLPSANTLLKSKPEAES